MVFANCADPDQTAPEESTPFAIPLNNLRNHKKQNLGKKSME